VLLPLASARADYVAQRGDVLEVTIPGAPATAREELAALEVAEQQQEAVLEQQVKESARMRDLLQKGVGTILRTEDSQRGLAQAQAQVQEVRVRLAQARKEVEDARAAWKRATTSGRRDCWKHSRTQSRKGVRPAFV
jgi:hypothetical protein